MANATMATESPVAVATSASDTPPVITVGAPISPPTAAKERIMPTTVPKRPSNGAIVTIMLSQLRPRFKRSSMYPTTSCKRFSKPSALYTDLDVVINVQGDEPMIDPNLIDDLARLFEEDPNLQMATVATPLLEEEYEEPSAVKVILNNRNDAMYFSRSLIPYPRHDFVRPPLKHIGIYAYRREFLLNYAKMEPTPAEQTESLEQLRALENGYTIRVILTNKRFIGVDTPEDLARVNAIYEQEEK